MRAPPMRSITRRGTSLPCEEESFELAGGGSAVVEPSGSRARRRHELSRDGSGVCVEGSDGATVDGRSAPVDGSLGSLPRRLRQTDGERSLPLLLLSPLLTSPDGLRSRPSPPPIVRTVGPRSLPLDPLLPLPLPLRHVPALPVSPRLTRPPRSRLLSPPVIGATLPPPIGATLPPPTGATLPPPIGATPPPPIAREGVDEPDVEPSPRPRTMRSRMLPATCGSRRKKPVRSAGVPASMPASPPRL